MDFTRTLTPSDAKIWARTGVLAAFALVLSYIETFVPLPVPIPGAKLGLANIAILIAFRLTDTKSALAIALIKTLVTGFMFGSPIMIPYSAGGTLTAFIAMWALVKVPGLHIVLISIIGSLFHIAGQLSVATILLGSTLVWFTFPLLAIIGCIMGALTGWVASHLINILENTDLDYTEKSAAIENPATSGNDNFLYIMNVESANKDMPHTENIGRISTIINTKYSIVAFFIYVTIVICAPNAWLLGICFMIAVLASIIVRIKLTDVAKAALPLISILIITAIAQILYNQQGAIVAVIGPVSITYAALYTTIFMLVRLACIMLASVVFVRAVPLNKISSALAKMIGRFSKFGRYADAFALALDLSISFIPVLTEDFKKLRSNAIEHSASFGKGGLTNKIKDYAGLIEPLSIMAFHYADSVAITASSDKSDNSYEVSNLCQSQN